MDGAHAEQAAESHRHRRVSDKQLRRSCNQTSPEAVVHGDGAVCDARASDALHYCSGLLGARHRHQIASQPGAHHPSSREGSTRQRPCPGHGPTRGDAGWR